VLTALKTGNVLLWPCAALIIGIGTVRAFQMRKYRTAHPGPVVPAGQALGAALCDRRHGLRRRYWAVWCFLTIFGNNDAVAHMICVAATVGYTAGGAARNYGRPKLIQYHILLACGPMSLALGDACRFLLHRSRRAAGAVLRRPQGHQPQPARHLRQGADVELQGSGAGRPVRLPR
jgi:hypothetical protein